jgi:hypothetical protein
MDKGYTGNRRRIIDRAYPQSMLKMLQRMHDERPPLDVAEIQDKFINTLLTLAEHLNRLKYCRNRFVGSRKFKDVYGV